MQKIFSIFIIIFLVAGVTAQNPIPNGGFESWTNGNPDGWFTNNFPPTTMPVTQSTNSHSGNYAARGEVINAFGVPYTPVLSAGEFGAGIPISSPPAQLTGYYQFSPVGNDLMEIVVLVHADSILIG